MYKDGYLNSSSQNRGKNFFFYINGWDKRGEEPKSGSVVHGNDTVFYSTASTADLPGVHHLVNTNHINYAQRYQEILESKKKCDTSNKKNALGFHKFE